MNHCSKGPRTRGNLPIRDIDSTISSLVIKEISVYRNNFFSSIRSLRPKFNCIQRPGTATPNWPYLQIDLCLPSIVPLVLPFLKQHTRELCRITWTVKMLRQITNSLIFLWGRKWDKQTSTNRVNGDMIRGHQTLAFFIRTDLFERKEFKRNHLKQYRILSFEI